MSLLKVVETFYADLLRNTISNRNANTFKLKHILKF